MIALSAIAARTEQVKLGTICMASFPMRHPIQVAIQWASLDVLSHGRTILAVCNGAAASDGPQFKHELEVFGMPLVGAGRQAGGRREGHTAPVGQRTKSPTRGSTTSFADVGPHA